MPGKDSTKVASRDALTIVLGKNHQVHYYFGLNAPADPTVVVPPLHTADFGPQGIRQVLLAFRRQEPKGVILIKSGSAAVYRDMVDILDEMSITDQSRYALTDLSAADRQLLEADGKE
jgi:hypothetical protein